MVSVCDITVPMATGRPSKGLTEKFLLRLSPTEKTMAQQVAEEKDCSLNDAIRICIRRGWAVVTPTHDTDGPVLDPDHWKPVPLGPVPKITGQEEFQWGPHFKEENGS